MVKHPRVAFFQTLILFATVIGNIVVQYMSYWNLNQISGSTTDIDNSKKYLLWSIILQSVALVVLLLAGLLFMIYSKSISYSNAVFYSVMFICGILLVGGSVLGVMMSRKLECFAGDDINIKKALQMMSISSLMGIAGPFLLIFVQTFATDQDSLEELAKQYLANKKTVSSNKPPPIPPSLDSPPYLRFGRKASMPKYNPSLYSSPNDDLE